MLRHHASLLRPLPLLSLLAVAPACGSDSEGDDSPHSGGDANGGAGGNASGGAASGGSSGGAVGSGGASSGGTSPTGGVPSGGMGGEASGGLAGNEAGGSDGAGGNASGGEGAGGDAPGGAGGGTCEPFRRAPRGARSGGFAGSDEQYSELYMQPCVEPSDCEAPCAERGGVDWFCEAHVCVDSEPDYCLPPTKWRGVDRALIPTDDPSTAAETSLGTSNGTEQDRLILQDFLFDIPDDATIRGIQLEVRRLKQAASTDVRDYAVRLVRDDEEVGTDFGTTELWAEEWETAQYGGPTELWGENWTPADINAETFGAAIGALPNGGGRAYIDIAYITVFAECP